jgi:fumarate hydratase subunit alpha
MRRINAEKITDAVAKLCIDANKILPDDIVCAIDKAKDSETFPLGKAILSDIRENIEAAKQLDIPVCQDTGMAVVFLKIGQQVEIVGGSLYDAVNEGVKKGYIEGKLRLSVVADPLRRVNTETNAPAIIHTEITDGDNIEITVAPKGFGSENMSGIKMLTPAADRQTIIDSVVEIVKAAGSNPCPPMVIGVGIGGDFEYCALLSKKALCRPTNVKNPDAFYSALEDDILKAVNETDIGPQGFSGKTTALSVNIETFPTHIAGLPLAVNIGCHVTRHKSVTL